MQKLNNIFHRVIDVCIAAGSAVLVGIMLLIVVNIVLRMADHPIPGHYEILTVMIIIPIGFALVYSAVQKNHVVIDFVVQKLSQKTQAFLKVFTSLLSVGIWAAITWAGIAMIPERLRLGEVSQTIYIPYFPFRLVWVFRYSFLPWCFLPISWQP